MSQPNSAKKPKPIICETLDGGSVTAATSVETVIESIKPEPASGISASKYRLWKSSAKNQILLLRPEKKAVMFG